MESYSVEKNIALLSPIFPSPRRVFIVTGYSGAGKSSVLRALEDCGFICVDNLPYALVPAFFSWHDQTQGNNQPIALGIDVRSGNTMEQLTTLIQQTIKTTHTVKVFFVTSSAAVLIKRFQETRRKHPLAQDLAIADAIEQEKVIMRPLMTLADLVLDTDQCTIHQLRSFVRSAVMAHDEQKMLVSLVSFGFKYGVPPESNFVYDVSFLPNPYFVPHLKVLHGKDKQIEDYLFSTPQAQEYWNKFLDFVTYCIKKSHQEGRYCITVAIGCTGGRHRSVAFIERLSKQALDNVHFLVKHRDIENEDYLHLSK